MKLKDMRLELLKINLNKDYETALRIKYGRGFRALTMFKIWQIIFDMVCKEQIYCVTHNGRVIMQDDKEPTETLRKLYNGFMNNEPIKVGKFINGDKPKYKVLEGV